MTDLSADLTALQAHLLCILGGEEVPTPAQMGALWGFHRTAEECEERPDRVELLRELYHLPTGDDRHQHKVVLMRRLMTPEGALAFQQGLREMRTPQQGAVASPEEPPAPTARTHLLATTHREYLVRVTCEDRERLVSGKLVNHHLQDARAMLREPTEEDWTVWCDQWEVPDGSLSREDARHLAQGLLYRTSRRQMAYLGRDEKGACSWQVDGGQVSIPDPVRLWRRLAKKPEFHDGYLHYYKQGDEWMVSYEDEGWTLEYHLDWRAVWRPRPAGGDSWRLSYREQDDKLQLVQGSVSIKVEGGLSTLHRLYQLEGEEIYEDDHVILQVHQGLLSGRCYVPEITLTVHLPGDLSEFA